MRVLPPRTIATSDLMLELAARCVESQHEHSRVVGGFLRLLRLIAMPSSQRQGHHTAVDLRDLADDLEVPVHCDVKRYE
jgi:hypothetical protein